MDLLVGGEEWLIIVIVAVIVIVVTDNRLIILVRGENGDGGVGVLKQPELFEYLEGEFELVVMFIFKFGQDF